MRTLNFSDGFTSSSAPTGGTIAPGSITIPSYANDATYVTAKGTAAVVGDIYYNTTNSTYRVYRGSAWINLPEYMNPYATTAAFVTSKGSAAANGDYFYDTTLNIFRGYFNSAWREIITGDQSQVLTNKDIDGGTASNTNRLTVPKNSTSNINALTRKEGTFIYDSTLDILYYDDGVALHEVISNNKSQVLTFKDYDGGTATDTSRITIPKDTLANLLALTRKEGTIVYATDTLKIYYDDGTTLKQVGSGSGTGGINYAADNPDAENNVNGYSAFADAAATKPVDGTGGTPNVTITRTTSTPLRGDGSFRITKDAADRQGEGVSFDFEIDEADLTQPINISFDYRGSANFEFGSDSTLGDINIYIYDVTNAVLIQPASFKLTGDKRFSGRFQAASDSNDYRLIFFIPTTNASAWTFDFDNLIIGPQVNLFGFMGTDWEAYTPTISGFGTVSAVDFYSRRVGDTLEVKGNFTAGTVAASTASVSIGFQGADGNVSIDVNKIGTNKQIIGKAGVDSNSATIFDWSVIYGTTSVVYLGIQDSATPSINVPVNGNQIAGTGSVISMFFTIPIVGWGSNLLMGRDADTRVTVARVSLSTPQSISNATLTKVVWDTVEEDTHGAVDFANSRVLIQSAGYYLPTLVLEFENTSSTGLRQTLLRKNGTTDYGIGFNAPGTVGSANATFHTGSTPPLYLLAGDYLEIWVQQTSGGSLNISPSGIEFNNFGVTKVQGPALPVAGDNCELFVWHDSNQISLTNATDVLIPFNTIDFDTHGAYSAGVWTAPRSGTVDYESFIRLDGGSSSNETELKLFKNGSAHTVANKYVDGNGDCLNLSGRVRVMQGDTLEIYAKNNAGSTRTTASTTFRDTHFSLKLT